LEDQKKKVLEAEKNRSVLPTTHAHHSNTMPPKRTFRTAQTPRILTPDDVCATLEHVSAAPFLAPSSTPVPPIEKIELKLGANVLGRNSFCMCFSVVCKHA
jgi:hypothetical protein